MVGVGATSRYPVSRISVVKDDAGANTLSLSYKVGLSYSHDSKKTYRHRGLSTRRPAP